jgi:hypothetical protein
LTKNIEDNEDLLKFSHQLQDKLRTHWVHAYERADLMIDIEETWHNPDSVKKKLLSLYRNVD